MSCGELMNAFQKANRWHAKDPKTGDLVIFEWKNSSGVLSRHIGIVYKTDTNYIYTIEGNTSGKANTVIQNGGGVFKKSYSKSNSRIKGYCRPKYTKEPTVVIAKPVLKLGNKSKEVGQLQKDLNTLGYTDSKGNYLLVDNSFGSKTEYALKAFQKAYKLTADGSYGPATSKKMLEVKTKWTNSNS
jgi:hypothetical protein